MRPAVVHRPAEIVGERLEVPRDDGLDVALVARLRPTALVVLTGHVLGLVGDLLEVPPVEPVEHPALARHDRHERAFPAAELPRERRDPELRADLPAVDDGRRERHDPEEAVARRREHRKRPSPVAVEIVLPPRLEALQVRLERESAVSAAGPALGQLLGVVDQGVELRPLGRHRGHRRRVEIGVDADRTAVVRAKRRQLPE